MCVSPHSFQEAGVQPRPDQAFFLGSHWAIIKPMGLWSQLRLGILIQTRVVVGRFHFLAAVEPMVACFFKVSRGISAFYLECSLSGFIIPRIIFALTQNQQS